MASGLCFQPFLLGGPCVLPHIHKHIAIPYLTPCAQAVQVQAWGHKKIPVPADCAAALLLFPRLARAGPVEATCRSLLSPVARPRRRNGGRQKRLQGEHPAAPRLPQILKQGRRVDMHLGVSQQTKLHSQE